MRLLGYALNKIQVLPDNKTAYIALSEAELKEFNYQRGDTEGMVNYPFGINGINFCALFMEWEGMVKISLRSKGKIDVNKIARAHFYLMLFLNLTPRPWFWSSPKAKSSFRRLRCSLIVQQL